MILDTQGALARAVGRSQPTIARWIHRSDWPFGAGPWRSDIVPKINAWAIENVGEDPALFSREAKAAAVVPAPGRWRVTPAQVLSEPLFSGPLGRFFGRPVAKVALDELDWAADLLTLAIGELLIGEAMRRGERGLRAEAPESYYDDLMRAIQPAALIAQFNRVFMMTPAESKMWWEGVK